MLLSDQASGTIRFRPIALCTRVHVTRHEGMFLWRCLCLKTVPLNLATRATRAGRVGRVCRFNKTKMGTPQRAYKARQHLFSAHPEKPWRWPGKPLSPEGKEKTGAGARRWERMIDNSRPHNEIAWDKGISYCLTNRIRRNERRETGRNK